MAHPFAHARQSKVEHSRVGRMVKGYASGGGVHADEAADRKLVRGMVKGAALKADGEKSKHRADRFARGGKVKSKSGKTNVNVIIAPQGGDKVPPMLPPPGVGAAGPPPVAMRPPMAPPPGVGAGMPPPGAMPPPGIRSSGGRAYAKGGAVKSGPAWEEGRKEGTQVQHAPGKNDGKDIGRGKPITYQRGGGVPDSGNRGVADLVSERDAAQQARENAAHRLSKGVLRKTGGPVYSPAKGGMSPKFEGGAGGGLARIAKAKRAVTKYAKAH
jgi:hypothetical protein